MKDVSVSDFKSHLAAYLREVQGGESICITEHKRRIAEVRSSAVRGVPIRAAERPFSLADSSPRIGVTAAWDELLYAERAER